MSKKIPKQWKGYRQRNLVAALGLVVGYPAVGLVVIAIKLWLPDYADVSFIVLTIMWSGIWVWSVFRASKWPCPRCGSAWLSSQRLKHVGENSCSKCGLNLYEEF